jgi:hypothetical protein
MIFIIYKIQINDFIYIGSTNNFRQRQQNHKYTCNNPNDKNYNDKKYQVIRENGGWKDDLMTEIESFECNTKTESRIREQYFIGYFDATLNSIRAFRSEEELKEQDRIRQARYYAKEEKCELIKKKRRERYQREKTQKIICS